MLAQVISSLIHVQVMRSPPFLKSNSLFGLTHLVGPALSRSNIDGFVPRTQHVNLRIVRQPDFWRVYGLSGTASPLCSGGDMVIIR